MNKLKLVVALMVAMIVFPSCDTSSTVTPPPAPVSPVDGTYEVSGLAVEGLEFTDFFFAVYDVYVIEFFPITSSRGELTIDGFGQDPDFGNDFEISLDADYRLTSIGTIILTEPNGTLIGEYEIDFDGRFFLLTDFAGDNPFDLDELLFPPGVVDPPYFIGPGDEINVEFVER